MNKKMEEMKKRKGEGKKEEEGREASWQEKKEEKGREGGASRQRSQEPLLGRGSHDQNLVSRIIYSWPRTSLSFPAPWPCAGPGWSLGPPGILFSSSPPLSSPRQLGHCP